jgi:hypothetical protein
MSRRTLLSLLVPAVLIVVYFGVTSYIRAHVDELIQHSVGNPVPPFSLADSAGKTWTAADLQGKRALLHFFRSRCHAWWRSELDRQRVTASRPNIVKANQDLLLRQERGARARGLPDSALP